MNWNGRFQYHPAIQKKMSHSSHCWKTIVNLYHAFYVNFYRFYDFIWNEELSLYVSGRMLMLRLLMYHLILQSEFVPLLKGRPEIISAFPYEFIRTSDFIRCKHRPSAVHSLSIDLFWLKYFIYIIWYLGRNWNAFAICHSP